MLILPLFEFWRTFLEEQTETLDQQTLAEKTNCFVRKCFFILLNEKTDKCSAISVFLSFHFFRLKIFKIIFGLHLNIECGTSNIYFLFLKFELLQSCLTNCFSNTWCKHGQKNDFNICFVSFTFSEPFMSFNKSSLYCMSCLLCYVLQLLICQTALFCFSF